MRQVQAYWDASMMSALASRVMAIMTMLMVAILIAAMTSTIAVIIATRSATSALAAVGTTIITIPATASFYSTGLAAAIRCARNIRAIGVKEGMIIIANTEAMIALAGVMMIGAKVGGKTCATAAEPQMTNGAAEVAV